MGDMIPYVNFLSVNVSGLCVLYDKKFLMPISVYNFHWCHPNAERHTKLSANIKKLQEEEWVNSPAFAKEPAPGNIFERCSGSKLHGRRTNSQRGGQWKPQWTKMRISFKERFTDKIDHVVYLHQPCIRLVVIGKCHQVSRFLLLHLKYPSPQTMPVHYLSSLIRSSASWVSPLFFEHSTGSLSPENFLLRGSSPFALIEVFRIAG